jgi:hypothetical protein
MNLIVYLLVFAAGMFVFAFFSRKWGYQVGVGIAKKRMKDLGLTEEDKEIHK